MSKRPRVAVDTHLFVGCSVLADVLLTIDAGGLIHDVNLGHKLLYTRYCW
jgi:hypothetical protein